jgi:pyrroloquinoline quinone (PQQ) biosynthesis protein C
MEHFQCGYAAHELAADRVRDNFAFVRRLEKTFRGHRLYDHPLNLALAEGQLGGGPLRFVLTQMFKMIEPYTAMLALLAGRAPDLRSRHVIFDNLYEEMGRGALASAHPSLWLRFLESIGVAAAAAEAEPPVRSIARMNARMREAVLREPFPAACAWISFSELPIPNIFGYLVRAVERSFSATAVDMEFFDRHGVRDEGHAEDTTLLIALHADPGDRPTLEREARDALELRAQVWDELYGLCLAGRTSWGGGRDGRC